LSSQVKALTKEKKEKENVLTNLEFINLNNASLLNFEEIRKKSKEAKIEKMVETNKEHKRNL
jgi:hypothetical protein